MPGARSFTELQFWQRAREWSKEIFRLTKEHPFARDQRLVVQINAPPPPEDLAPPRNDTPPM
jgi:hypothetical protein